VQGSYTFDSVKGSLPNDNTTLVQLYAPTCFGGTPCDSSHPKNPAYLVEAVNDATRPNSFWLYSTGCVPGPAANPCPAGTIAAADPSDINLSTSAQVTGNVQAGGQVKIGNTTYANSNTPPSPNPSTNTQVGGTVTHDTASDQVVLSPLPDCGPYTNLTGKLTQYTDSSYTTVVASPTWKYGNVTACGTCGVPGMAGYA